MYLNLLDSFVICFANNNAITQHRSSSIGTGSFSRPRLQQLEGHWPVLAGDCTTETNYIRHPGEVFQECLQDAPNPHTHTQVYASFICPFHPCFMLHDADELHLDVWHHLQKEQCIAPGTTFFTGANACVEGCLRVLATISDCSEVHSCSWFPTTPEQCWKNPRILITDYVNPHISTR